MLGEFTQKRTETTMRSDEDASTVVFGVILLFLLIPFSAVWRGFVLTKLWAWFVVPFGPEPIGIAHAIGLSLAVVVFANTTKPEDDKPFKEQVVGAIAKATVTPAFVWLMAAIVHAFM